MPAENIEKVQIALLEQLSNAAGVSGAEGAVRKIVLEALKPLADEIIEDSLGNVIARKKAKQQDALKVMLAAHLDEVGLILKVDEGDGLYSFSPVGDVDVRQLPGKMVLVGPERVPGVIGARAIHLTTAEERRQAIPLQTLRIDVGVKDRVKVGDRVVFATRFWENETSVFGKALDDRLGVALLLELFKSVPDDLDLYFAFTSQKELGHRGEMVAAFNIEPDIVILVDSALANDYPPGAAASENMYYESRLGAGPVIYPMYRKVISDPGLFEYFIKTAEENEIPYQIRQATSQDTRYEAAGSINRQRAGIRSITISIPGRNPHSAIGIARKADWGGTLKLLQLGLAGLKQQAP